MSTVIRDINGNTVRKTIRHALINVADTEAYHFDGTGLFCSTYSDYKGVQFQAFVRPETHAEHRYIHAARKIGTNRDA